MCAVGSYTNRIWYCIRIRGVRNAAINMKKQQKCFQNDLQQIQTFKWISVVLTLLNVEFDLKARKYCVLFLFGLENHSIELINTRKYIGKQNLIEPLLLRMHKTVGKHGNTFT